MGLDESVIRPITFSSSFAAAQTRPLTVEPERLTLPFARMSPLIVMELPFIQP